MRNIFLIIAFFSLILSSKDVNGQVKSKSPVKKAAPTKPLQVGDLYKGGKIYEIYQDGSGIKVFFGVEGGIYNSIQKSIKKAQDQGLNLYMANDYDLQKLFQLGFINPESNPEHGSWRSLWFMGDRRMASFSYPYAHKASSIRNLSYDSNERIADIVQYAYKIDRYDGECLYALVGIFSLK